MSVPSSEAAHKLPQRRMAVICGAVILTIGIGARQSLGIFQKPIAAAGHGSHPVLCRRAAGARDCGNHGVERGASHPDHSAICG